MTKYIWNAIILGGLAVAFISGCGEDAVAEAVTTLPDVFAIGGDTQTATVDTYQPECTSDEQCGPALASCEIPICVGGTCSMAPAADGVTCSVDSPQPCSLGAACKAGECIEVVNDCDDDDSCTDDLCDAQSNSCTNTAIENCGAECAVDIDCADKVDGCNVPTCVAGVCGSSPAPDGTPCTEEEWTGDLCIVAGRCEAGSCTAQNKDCDDSVECTVDSCAPETGCVNTEKTEGCSVVECTAAFECVDILLSSACKKADCIDSKCVVVNLDGDACAPQGGTNLCLEGGSCVDGDCIATAKDCDDGVECTLDTCDPATGECSSEPQGEDCGDDKLCTTDEECLAGEFCDKGLIPVIGEDLCKPQKADGVFCTGDNQCTSGTCGGCISVGESLQSGWCYTAETKAVGQLCKVDQECTSGSCSATCPLPGPGACECQLDSDCQAGEWCDLGAFGGLGQNECKAKKGECQSCDTNNQCLSDSCSISFDGGSCTTDASLAIGATCCNDAQCISGNCVDAQCVTCSANGDCDAETQFCDDGTCADKKELEVQCDSNSECLSGQCEGFQQKVCVCGTSEDCAAGEYCNAILGLPNSCKAATAECATCTPGFGECGVGAICEVALQFSLPVCVVPASKNVGEECCRNKQCISNTCTDGACE